MASGKRDIDETFENYKLRLKAQAVDDKKKSHGILIWNSSKQGTYNKLMHGVI